jgi:hypothetical protein
VSTLRGSLRNRLCSGGCQDLLIIFRSYNSATATARSRHGPTVKVPTVHRNEYYSASEIP